MNPSRGEEIAASVGAHRDLGPAYDDVVAAGLVERIGAEVNRRVNERISSTRATPGQRPAAIPRPAGQRSICQPFTPVARSPGSRPSWPSAPW